MSWIERIQNDIIIRTGDGKTYNPLWINAVMLQEYNFAVFNFANIPGSYVNKREPRGRKFNMELHFTGDDHLDVSENFRLSAQNKRPWRVTHPFYGQIILQPQALKFDNREYNDTVITGIFIETISTIAPLADVSNLEEIESRKIAVDETVAQNYGNQTNNIQPGEITAVNNNIESFESTANQIIQEEEEKISFKNAIIGAQRAIVTIIQQPIGAMREIQAAVNFPFAIAANVDVRVDAFIEQANRLGTTIGNVTGLSRNEKVFYESQGANLISAATIASVTNVEDFPYNNRQEVNDISEKIIGMYNDYIVILDQLQTESQTEKESYAPNPDVLRGLQEIVSFTLSVLAEIALDSQQEHIIINEADSNAIVLTHRVYGLDSEDENLQRFIDTNNIGLREILLIPKDRELVYYV